MRPGFVEVPIHICNIPGKSSKCVPSDASVVVVLLSYFLVAHPSSHSLLPFSKIII